MGSSKQTQILFLIRYSQFEKLKVNRLKAIFFKNVELSQLTCKHDCFWNNITLTKKKRKCYTDVNKLHACISSEWFTKSCRPTADPNLTSPGQKIFLAWQICVVTHSYVLLILNQSPCRSACIHEENPHNVACKYSYLCCW